MGRYKLVICMTTFFIHIRSTDQCTIKEVYRVFLLSDNYEDNEDIIMMIYKPEIVF